MSQKDYFRRSRVALLKDQIYLYFQNDILLKVFKPWCHNPTET